MLTNHNHNETWGLISMRATARFAQCHWSSFPVRNCLGSSQSCCHDSVAADEVAGSLKCQVWPDASDANIVLAGVTVFSGPDPGRDTVVAAVAIVTGRVATGKVRDVRRPTTVHRGAAAGTKTRRRRAPASEEISAVRKMLNDIFLVTYFKCEQTELGIEFTSRI